MSEDTYLKYRVYCVTEKRQRYWVLRDDEPIPRKCPEDTSHNIDPVLTTVVDTISTTVAKIKEEAIPTGGHFSTKTITVDIAEGQEIGVAYEITPYPISALAMNFVTDQAMFGDTLDVIVGDNTPIGGLVRPMTQVQEWSSKVYQPGEIVIFNHPFFGKRVYTCVLPTTSNESPLIKSHWIHGYRVTVSDNVLDYVAIGYYAKLSQGSHQQEMKHILFIDKDNKHVYLENPPTTYYSFDPSNPILFKISIHVVENFTIGYPWEYNIGESKIGGSYVPADMPVKVKYRNNNGKAKKFIGRVEFLY